MFSVNTIKSLQVPFDLGNGELIYFKTAKDFDYSEYAEWQRLQTALPKISTRRQKAKNDNAQISAEKKNKELCTAMVNLCLPELKGDFIEGLTVGQLDKLAAICINVASGRYANGLLDNPDDVQKIMDSHDLPYEFVSSLTRKQAQILIDLPEKEPDPND